MKANELRIGNVVDTPQGYYQIKYISEKAIDEEVGPIPLTTEILEKCNFSVAPDGDGYVSAIDSSFRIICRNGKDFFYVGGIRMIQLASLHQLQNLFYALTQIELVYVDL